MLNVGDTVRCYARHIKPIGLVTIDRIDQRYINHKTMNICEVTDERGHTFVVMDTCLKAEEKS